MTISLLEVKHFNTAHNKGLVVLPSTSENLQNETFVLNPSTFSVKEWRSFQTWEVAAKLAFDFTSPVPADLRTKE